MGIESYYLDTAPIIYFLEGNELYASKIKAFFLNAIEKKHVFITSSLTRLEYSILPEREKRLDLLRDFQLFLTSVDVNVIPISESIISKAIELRAHHQGLKTPDAIHVATALEAGCSHLVTNDFRLKVDGMELLLVSQL